MLLYLDLAYQKASREGRLRTLGDLQATIVEGAAKRLRPKFMTMATTFIGLIPIMWATGTGSDVWKRIAAPMVGGIFTSFVLELVVYPAIYEMLEVALRDEARPPGTAARPARRIPCSDSGCSREQRLRCRASSSWVRPDPWSPHAAPGARCRPRSHGVRPRAVQAAARSRPSVRPHGRPQRRRAADLVRGQDALINCAGHVADGEAFVALIDRLVTAVDSLPAAEQPVCWFLGRGAPRHRLVRPPRRRAALGEVHLLAPPVNVERLSRSRLDWRLLCPGPMVDEPAIGPDRLRISLDALPVNVPAFAPPCRGRCCCRSSRP